jgi:hypothetical protein
MALSVMLDGERAASEVIAKWKGDHVLDACHAATQIGSIHAGDLLKLERAKTIVKLNLGMRKVDEEQPDVWKAFDLGCGFKITSQEIKDRYLAANDNVAGGKPAIIPIEIFWHGKEYNRAARSWLVKDLILDTGHGLASGQWGACKTFGVLDLSASVMTGTSFAGREVCRRGGVLFIAAEGANEIPVRLKGVVDHKLRLNDLEGAADLDNLPFAWIEECPSLKDEAGFKRIVAIGQTVVGNMKEKFDLPLALIVVDTLSAAADFDDANAAAEGQRVMNRLNALGRATGAVVLAVDHFGKAVETGTRGTSAKEASADFVLAFLAEKSINGTVSNTRMAVRKLRGGATGAETPFDLTEVDIGDDTTTCIIEWKADREPQSRTKGTASKNPWQSLKLFRSSVQTALAENGKLTQPFGNEGPKVRSVPLHFVRSEFVAGYPADGETEEQKQDAKRKAFKRNLDSARNKNLVCCRDVGGTDHVWLVNED